MADKIGRIAHHPRSGWYIDFRSVEWPGRRKKRRVWITRAPDYGKFETEREAYRTLMQIRAQWVDGKPLHEILAHYMTAEVPEDMTLHRWNHQYLPAMRGRRDRGRLSAKRVRELELYEGRGHLEFWRHKPLRGIRSDDMHRFLEWLETEFPKLAPRTIKHVVTDFATFLRFEKTFHAAIDEVPAIPTVDVPTRTKRVPIVADLGRILAEIDEPIRGIFMARSLAGLRPSESRRLDVSDYDAKHGVLRIPPEKCKTKRGRDLLIRQVVPELDAWILEHRKEARPWDPLFVNPNSPTGRWADRTERRRWNAAVAACGFEHVRMNEGGRHAFATHRIAQGVDVHAVKDWLGHSTLASTDVYNTVDAVNLARRMEPSKPRSGGPTVDGGKRRP